MKQEELNKILAEHKLWLGNKGGNRADLSGSVLRNSDLSGSDLIGSDLSGSVLSGSVLRNSVLRDSDLSGSDLRNSDLRNSDLRNSDLSGSDLRNSDLSGSDLRNSDLSGSNLYGANLDYSCWPLWCGSLDAHIDDRLARQLLYHLMRPCLVSPDVSDDFKRALFTPALIAQANKFHRVEECGKIDLPEEIKHCEQDKHCSNCAHYADGGCFRAGFAGVAPVKEADSCTRWKGKTDGEI